MKTLALTHGLLISRINRAHVRTLRLLPPFIITRSHIEVFLDELVAVLRTTKTRPQVAASSLVVPVKAAALAAAR